MTKTYLALGDSMSIDDYTGVAAGGAVAQLHHRLPREWNLVDETFDGCTMAGVPTELRADLITLTIGGNDLLLKQDHYLAGGIDDFRQEHRQLLQTIRQANTDAIFIVGDIYAPQSPLTPEQFAGLEAANAIIKENVQVVDAVLAEIFLSFRRHEDEYLCFDIEPSLRGAQVIAALFFAAFAASAQDA